MDLDDAHRLFSTLLMLAFGFLDGYSPGAQSNCSFLVGYHRVLS
jgi:hypothetical protein